jgi:hypothetical protein
MKIEETKNKLKIHEFNETFMESQILIRFIIMEECHWIYIGYVDQIPFFDLSISMKNEYSNLPLSTTILKDSVDLYSKTLSEKICLKTKLVTYLSYNLESNDEIHFYIERKLFDLLKIIYK